MYNYSANEEVILIRSNNLRNYFFVINVKRINSISSEFCRIRRHVFQFLLKISVSSNFFYFDKSNQKVLTTK